MPWRPIKVNLLDSGQVGSDRHLSVPAWLWLIGFGGLLLIMALAGIDALRVLQQFRHSDEQIRRRYLSQNHVLNDIRSDVYVSGTYVRDYLLEPDPERAEAYRTSLEDVREAHGVRARILRPPGSSGQKLQHYSALCARS